MRNIFVFFLTIFMTGPLLADEQTRAIQERLREQGFYYGEVDGRGGDETSAAIRRYQIRHGLRVTGQVDDETLRSLGMTGDENARRQDDRHYYQDRQPDYQEYQRPQPYFARPGRAPGDFQEGPSFRPPAVATTYPRLFLGTVYEGAPVQVQENVLFAVQG